MEKPIKITAGSTYIFKGKKANNDKTYNKFKITEVTDTTYYVENVDKKISFRCGIVDFNYNYKPVELIESNEQKIINYLKK